MKTVIKRVSGKIITGVGITALKLYSFRPESDSHDLICLRFAFVTRGRGDHIFPSFILDDWGREIRGLKLYEWVRENGERFPRGEIFGLEQDGRETQCFLRELELYARLPTYVYQSDEQTVSDGRLLNAVFLSEESIDAPSQIRRPATIRGPMQSALVSWWRVPLNIGPEGLSFLKVIPDPGY